MLKRRGTDAQITRGGYKWYLLEGDSTGDFSFTTVSFNSSDPSYFGTPGTYSYTAVYSDGETTVKVQKDGGMQWKVTVGGTTTTYYDDHYVASHPGFSGRLKSEMCQQYPFIENC